MSAPPLVDRPAMPTMVSRLPKFGFRPRSQTAPAAVAPAAAAPPGGAATAAGRARLTNGFYHHPGPAGVSVPLSSAKQNGFIRVPCSFSAKWRRENAADGDEIMAGEAECKRGKGGNDVQNRSNCQPYFYLHDARKHTTSTAAKGRGQLTSYSSSSSSPSPQSSPRALPVSKNGSGGSKLTPNSSVLSKQSVNTSPGSKAGTKAITSLRPPQSFVRLTSTRPGSGPASRSGSPLLKKPTASRSHSSDNLGCAASAQLTESDRFRSRSLTQVRQQASPTLTRTAASPHVSRPFSTNRATQRVPPVSTSQAPPRGSLLKSPVSRAASGRAAGSAPSQLPQSALRKPLLPGPTSRSSGISYKLSRPSLVKQSRPLRAKGTSMCRSEQEVNRGPTRRKNSVETPSSIENSPENTPDAAEMEQLSDDVASQGMGSIVGETLEDMSLSSTSSLDRNDISQEYMDDFDNLGNGGVGILLFSSKNEEDDSGLDQSCTRIDDDRDAISKVAKTTGLCFLDDSLDWTSIRGDKDEHRLNQLARRRKSSQPDFHEQGGSSLDLSPSDSCGSGGTYMWDEEGLEPLGGATTTASIHTSSNTTHHIGSFDSDINSIDLLNNLDSCDLADDDLMLDVDFPEDSSLHSDGEGLSSMAQWRRRQLCWGTQDNDVESDIQCFKLSQDPETKEDKIRSACCSPAPQTLGLDVEELAEDCSAVRSQLEFLQRLLLQEEDLDDDTLTTDTLSPETNDLSHSSDSQVEALLQEVQQLREELRSRDRTIAQLTMQLTVPTLTTRCRCQEVSERMEQQTQTSVTKSECVASQTPWREHTSQVFHSSHQEDQEPLTNQAPPSGNPAHAEMLPDGLPPSFKPIAATCTTPTRTTDDGNPQRKPGREEEDTERRGTGSRPLMPLHPSKLRLFLSHAANGSAPASPKARPSRQLLDRVNSPGLKAKAFGSGSSRLPKPKSY
ncbi:serine-rich coiled-coil domain-containing protein 2-like isoform X2 [Xiphophorus maculatus]|uniref:Serine-rich coiled-coil domain-containing protein 2-like n=1 Tax=Xiphophorus maculatus TaxID=8083 RepID=A0A3B5Q4D0_XIPMA|nr:serine-rich coiled-coil domain-containing protein 2-like isoform X2 [Xiphophorus maculatus]